MIDLAQRSEPYEIALPYGLTVTVKPLTTAGMTTAQAAARRTVEAIERQARERAGAGLPSSARRANATSLALRHIGRLRRHPLVRPLAVLEVENPVERREVIGEEDGVGIESGRGV
jgi:hypothetical protein